MIVAQPGIPFEILASEAPAGLVGTITAEVYDPTDASQVIAPFTAGITEPRPGTYRAQISVATAGTYRVRWTYDGESAEEDLTVGGGGGAIDPALVRPTVAEVSILERTRTVGLTSGGLGGDTSASDVTVFGADTRPTAAEVELIIDQAVEAVIAQIPDTVPVVFYGQIRHFAALYAAVLIEGSFFRESLDEGSVDLYRDLLTVGVPRLAAAIDEEVTEEGAGGFASLPVRSATVAAAYPVWPVVVP